MGAVGDPTQQFHDWEPGIEPSGLFWTIPFPSGAMSAAPGAGTARLLGASVAVDDYHDFFNAIAEDPDPAPRPAHVSFDVRWQGGGERMKVRDPDFGFVNNVVAGEATIDFRCQNDDSPVVYTSVADGQSTVSAGVGHERNGVFFS